LYSPEDPEESDHWRPLRSEVGVAPEMLIYTIRNALSNIKEFIA
jgi:hypothetical protein